MELIFQYPIWFISFCFLLGLLYSFVLYFNENHFVDESKNFKYIKLGLSFFRFLSVSILAFLLLSPLVKSRYIDKIKPLIIIAHDNSSSISFGFKKLDSAQYINSLNTLHQKLSKKYDVDFYTFSDKLSKKDTLNFQDKKTNISNVLDEINSNYYNRNVGAVIFATDGIYNEGQNPLYTDFNFPLYPIALGDTSKQKDLKIAAVRANKIAYLNDKVNVEIDLESYNLEGNSFSVSIFKSNKGKNVLVKKKSLHISKDYFEQSVSLGINANNIGVQKYIVLVSEIENEVTFENNQREFYIDVIDSRQNILILAAAPHPDIAVLKQTIALEKNLKVKVQYIKNFSENIKDYNLVILHQLPSKKSSIANVLDKLKNEKIPSWFITGASTGYTQINKHQTIVNVLPKSENINNVKAFYNQNFKSFNLSEKTIISLKNFPPLAIPFGDFKPNANSNTLLFQKIGVIETDYPLLSFSDNFGVKSAIFIGDGFWRWRMYDFLENGNQDAFNELFQKTISFLAIKSDKRKFRVSTQKTMFYEGENIKLEAELYNESYELINKPDASLIIKDEFEKEYPFVFNKTNNAYNIEISSLPVGSYSYTASTKYANKQYSAKGMFSVKKLHLETLETLANHSLLYNLANKTSGKVYLSTEIEKLSEEILNQKEIKTTLYESFKTRSIIHLQWLFYLIMALLSIEWFARKYFGSY